MVRYSIDAVTEEMILARSIVLNNGELMLAAGQKLNAGYIHRLKKLGIDSLYIEIEGTEEIDPKSIISTQIQREIAARLVSSEKNIHSILEMKNYSQDKVVELITYNKNEINDYITNSGFMECVSTIIDEVLENPAVVVNLASLEKKASYLFEHALRVTILSLCIAKKYNFTQEEMKQLALGAINSDIGLVAIPRQIVTSKQPLQGEEMNLFQKHAYYGNVILSNNPTIPATSACVAYQHHECQDSSGYPLGLNGENKPPVKNLGGQGLIHRFAEIVAVADNFDILVEGRSPYGYKISRREAMKVLFLSAESKLNSDIVLTFSKITPLYPVGTRVRIIKTITARYLGYFGAVVKDNPSNLARPIIVVYENKFHKKIDPFIIDLEDMDDVEIEAVL